MDLAWIAFLFSLFFFAFLVLFLSLLLCAQHEGTNQDPIATFHISYVSQAQQDSVLSALHRRSKYIQQYARIDQRG